MSAPALVTRRQSSLRDALVQVQRVLPEEPDAITSLHEGLSFGELEVWFGYCRPEKSQENVLPVRPLPWHNLKLEPAKNRIIGRVKYKSGRSRLYETGPVVFENVRVSQDDLERRYPTANAAAAAEADHQKITSNVGGAPQKHEWARAAAFLAAYIVENAPDKASATKAVKKWFAARGKSPDIREIERWVKHTFDDMRS